MEPSCPSSSSSDMSSPSTSAPIRITDNCAVCGDIFHSKQYGVPNCLGCVVFFRRAVQNKAKYRCWKDGKCVINFASRCACRCCRLEKCFAVGMQTKNIRCRDRLGPRDPRELVDGPAKENDEAEITFICEKKGEKPPSFHLDPLLQLQRLQRTRHDAYSIQRLCTIKSDHKYPKNATSDDVNFSLKLGMKDANDFANKFEPYQELTAEDQSSVLSEFGYGYIFIDQAFKTAQKAEDDEWYLHNEAIMYSDNYDIMEESADAEFDEWKTALERVRNDSLFAEELINSLGNPFRILKIDDIECVILKTLLLIAPSFSGRVAYKNTSRIFHKCLLVLMKHCKQKDAETASERFGEIVLMTSSIRCAVKSLYNQTKMPGIFDLKNIDPCFKKMFLT